MKTFSLKSYNGAGLGVVLQQSCEMSNILHGVNLPNQILPQEKRLNPDKFTVWNE